MTDEFVDESLPEYEYQGEVPKSAHLEPVPVVIHGTKTENVAPDFGSCMTWNVPQFGVGLPIQILPRRLRRAQAKISVVSFNAQALTTVQSVANPAAGAQAVYTVPAGTGPVTLEAVTYTLTTDAVVANRQGRVQILDSAGNVVATFQSTGNVAASSTVTVYLSEGNSQTANATSGSSFGSLAPITLYPGWKVQTVTAAMDPGDTITGFAVTLLGTTGGASSVVFNSRLDALTIPQGLTYSAVGNLPDWESQQPLYAIAVGGSVTIAVLDESYAE